MLKSESRITEILRDTSWRVRAALSLSVLASILFVWWWGYDAPLRAQTVALADAVATLRVRHDDLQHQLAELKKMAGEQELLLSDRTKSEQPLHEVLALFRSHNLQCQKVAPSEGSFVVRGAYRDLIAFFESAYERGVPVHNFSSTVDAADGAVTTHLVLKRGG